MQCNYYQEKKCLSCHKINQTYHSQLTEKQNYLLQTLAEFNPKQVNPPYASPESGFRNKAKMAVLGTVEKPILGIQNDNAVIDLCDCPLYSANMQHILKLVRTYIRKQGLVPYNINKRKGELKFVIITESRIGDESYFMLRFVLKSQKFVDKIKNSYQLLHDKINNLQVVTINIQPNHAAILEGDEELILTDNPFLAFQLNQVPLYIKSKSFFQTNSYIAEKLYKTASDWVANLNVNSIWDLFCGVGGFGLHCIQHASSHHIQLTGIEISPDAIECATKSAAKLGYDKLNFKSLDATKYVTNEQSIPDLLNPPRRGAGKTLIQYLQTIKPNYVLYSSCNLTSMAEDLRLLTDYQMIKVQLFDMFPHTSHMEVLVLLQAK